MSKTKILILSILFFVAYQGNSQIDFGIRFQTGFSNQVSTESTYLIGPNKSVEYNLQVNQVSNTQSIGAFTQFKFGWLYLQPEVLYTRYESQFLVDDLRADAVGMTEYNESYQQIDIPVNAGIRFKNFRLGGGPVFQMIQELNSDLSSLRNTEISPRSINGGFQGGIGYDWKILHFDLKYQRNFGTVVDHVNFGGSPADLGVSTSSFQFGIAVALEGVKK